MAAAAAEGLWSSLPLDLLDKISRCFDCLAYLVAFRAAPLTSAVLSTFPPLLALKFPNFDAVYDVAARRLLYGRSPNRPRAWNGVPSHGFTLLRRGRDVVYRIGNDPVVLYGVSDDERLQLPLASRSYWGAEIERAILSGPPKEPECIVVLLFGYNECFLFCRVGDSSWSEGWCSSCIQDMIFFEGKLYATLSESRLAVVHLFPAVQAHILGPLPLAPRSPTDLNSYQTLGMLRGELLIVCCNRQQDGYNVFRWDSCDATWTELLELGGATLFISDRRFFAAFTPQTASSGLSGDCIYVIQYCGYFGKYPINGGARFIDWITVFKPMGNTSYCWVDASSYLGALQSTPGV